MINRHGGLRGIGALVIDGVLWIVGRLRELAYAKVAGRYYEYKGNPIDIHEEQSGARWLSVRDVRRTLPQLPRDALLQRLFPQQLALQGDPEELRIEAAALEALLSKAQDERSIRFLRWLQRNVMFPATTKAARRSGAG